jgi:mono/diheme cytochrome c family protein
MINGMVVLYAAALSAFVLTGAKAQSVGEAEFMSSCAACHGIDGKGDGPVSKYLLNVSPDLTFLSKNNSGVFPATYIYDIIEGSADVAVHGGRDMPVWGLRYTDRSLSHQGSPASMGEAESYARALILSLVDYLSTLQVE